MLTLSVVLDVTHTVLRLQCDDLQVLLCTTVAKTRGHHLVSKQHCSRWKADVHVAYYVVCIVPWTDWRVTALHGILACKLAPAGDSLA